MVMLRSSLASVAIALSFLGFPLVYCGSYAIPYIPATYDYIIIGGGTSGLAIASRLAENSSISVAVVEAGGIYETDDAALIIPGFGALEATGASSSDLNPLIDWDFITTPMAGLGNRGIHYARGKTLGGSSARHFMVYQRGTSGAFQRWADLAGDQSYTFDNLLPYFKKSCHLTAPDYTKRNTNATVVYNAAAFDNSLDGPLQVSWPNLGSPLSTWVEIGMAAVGVLPGADLNSGVLNGSSWASTSIDPSNESRSSSQTSFLTNAMANTGIKVYLHTMAKKIVFKNTNVASGVQVETLGIPYTLTARKEVILSAGAFQSPQMLMVSGIGPRDTLEGLNIPVISELPGVGQNMWDHVMIGSTHEVNVTTATTLVSNLAAAAEAVVDYASGTGPLTAPGFGVLGWEKFPAATRAEFSNETLELLSTLPSDWPEVEYLGLDGVLGAWNSALDQFVGGNYGAIGAAVVAPFSRGNVTITSADSNVAPVINPNLLGHPADVEVTLAAMKRVRSMWANINVTIGDEYLPGPNVTTDAEIIDYLRSHAMTVWHAASTCAMGTSSDPMAVVDSTAKVFGVKGLRVVDASIFPILPPGHPQSSCYMIAEKIADDILSGR